MDTVLKSGWKNLRSMDLSMCGAAYGGVPRGVVSFIAFFSGGTLREVRISWNETVTDEDIRVLAATCANSLTSLEACGCNIGDVALRALADECENLAYLDVSECFDISNRGLLSLCPVTGRFIGDNGGSFHLPENRGCLRLRSLKLAKLPLTDASVLAIGGLYFDRESATMYRSEGGLKKLLVLDIHECEDISAWAVERAMESCQSLVELNAQDILGDVSLASAPATLRFLNGRRLNCAGHRRGLTSPGCCTVMTDSQRLLAKEGIEPLPMFYCIDC
jgi:hypothetical protein